MSKVILVFKKGNCRPISLMDVFNTILEKLMLKRLLDFLDRNYVLSKYQFGFRKDHSTTLAAIEIIKNIIKSLENCDLVAGEYLDLSKAFDTVDHEILLYKLDYYGIRGHVCEWFRHYLSDRQQCVSINGTVSEYAHVQTNVTQGSILGPVLFLLYINDNISTAVDNVSLPLFANDTNLFISGNYINDIVCTTRDKLQSLSVSFRHNQLTLNLNKTCYTMFGRQLYRAILPLLLQGKHTELVYTAKYLGIYLGCKLSWFEHIKECCTQMSKLSGVFHHIASFINAAMVWQLYYAYVFPHINYGIELYGSACKTNIVQIQVVQNLLRKTLPTHNRLDSATALHWELNIIKVHELFTLNVLIFVYKQPTVLTKGKS